jgi:broad specificity phosphatase PhoE
MKWPELMLLIRHDVSAYNLLKGRKSKSPLYQEFLRTFQSHPDSDKVRALAIAVQQEFALGVGDAETPLEDLEAKRAMEVGIVLSERYEDETPDVIFVSPYRRTRLTLAGIKRGWAALESIRVIEDERIREQEHGLALLYNDWRVFHALHPEQGKLYQIEGKYWYRFPQGESVPDVRARNRSWMNTVVRDFSEKRVLVVTHHLNILGIRANLERWDADQFIMVDEEDKPINCGVTAYRGDPTKGHDGHFKLEYYNHCLYEA